MKTPPTIPRFSMDDLSRMVAQHYDMKLPCQALASYIDQNARVGNPSGPNYVLKIANAGSHLDELDMQNRVLEHLAERDPALPVPRLVRTRDGNALFSATGVDGHSHQGRLLTFLPGSFLADTNRRPRLLERVGAFFARLDLALADFAHVAATRRLDWDLAQAAGNARLLPHMVDHADRALAQHFFDAFDRYLAPRLIGLPRQVIHNDGNDYNILADESDVLGLIDFGDMIHTPRICELAIVATYAMMGVDDPLAAASAVARGYHGVAPLLEDELDLLFGLICTRLATSVAKSAEARAAQPDNVYASVSELGAWRLLRRFVGLHPEKVRHQLRAELGMSAVFALPEAEQLRASRARHLNPTLSLSYRKPLQIMRGFRQFLYDEDGRAYLDCVNNVCHVGHCHPTVVRAGERQMDLLNTNTRYLHPHLVAYAERLLATFPPALSVVTFTCSGSEANELALRMARTHTKRQAVVVLEGAYHGNTAANIEISPYKYDRKGGSGRKTHIFPATMPDGYRGPHKGQDAVVGARYGEYVAEALRAAEEQGGAAAFIAESILGCGGQVVLPDGYLASAYAHAHEAGAVCIADEVQVGFGRVGSHFWAFETQGVVPDIVTLGKPIGNGHPLAAVVTTAEIAASFKTGMEYFNTFGGNPVSCAIGLAVLDVIERESLQRQAYEVGRHLLSRLSQLGERHALIGEVRGLGLFIGVELVRDRVTLEPATAEANEIVQRMKARGILLSTDGPLDNVLKLKPPLVFTQEDADRLVDELDQVLAEV